MSIETIVSNKDNSQVAKMNTQQRILSLDLFRGITVAAMILVNNPGTWINIYAPLRHSEWSGCTLADLIFPFFLFIMGVSIVYSMENKKKDNKTHAKLILSILKRSFIIIAIGIFLSLSSNFEWSTLRIPGVLPRIALAFCISAIIYVKTETKTQIYITAIILIGYYLIMRLLPVPGIGPANLDPATNLAAWLDRVIFTENHLWRGGKNLDPEGLLGTLPAATTVLIGIIAGTRLKSKKLNSNNELVRFIAIGIILLPTALIWNITFPINKSLWTSSYVLYTASFAILILTFLYWLIDIRGYTKYTAPFIAFGQNAITAYVIAGILATISSKIMLTRDGIDVNLWVYTHEQFFEPYLSPNISSLIPAILTVVIIFIPIWWLYSKRIIIKI